MRNITFDFKEDKSFNMVKRDLPAESYETQTH